jgi:hypothetical protein
VGILKFFRFFQRILSEDSFRGFFLWEVTPA